MQVIHDKFLVHTYYGKKKRGAPVEYGQSYRAFSPYFEAYGTQYSPNEAYHELPAFGGGDFRCTSLKIKGANGDSCTRLFYKSFAIRRGRKPLPGLPFASADEETETLEITLADEVTGCIVTLCYTVFEKYDVISRYYTVTNTSPEAFIIDKCMSLSLDIPGIRYDMISLPGGYAWERDYQRVPIHMGNQSVYSRRGSSSHNFNPFIAICDQKATEERGNVYGFNILYSGNFLSEAEASADGSVRVQIGIGEETFSWRLEENESFTAPEAVMTYSDKGLGQMSRNFHNFTRERICPPEKFPVRPVVLNTWEACYFDINEDVLVNFAKEAVKYDVDMLVMDDGWFGARVNDCAGLGDWFENRDRFPDGLASFVRRVKETGIKFGIWIEPEMVNPDSDLYRAHPEWVLQCKGRESTLSRNQLMLDMSNPEVVAYLKDSFEKTFGSVDIDYIKWDFNRNLAEVGSPVLPPERQMEAAHRFMLGTYELYRWFGERFPNVMIENCSGGGGRYDLGMMYYSTQIWASDHTGPQYRGKIQFGSTVCYPASVMSCHVSNPGGCCDNDKEMDYRFKVAVGGVLGYELNILTASTQVKAAMKKQIAEYRKIEPLILRGEMYRQTNYSEGNRNRYAYYFVNNDNTEILSTYIQYSGEKSKSKASKLKFSRADINKTYIDRYTGEEYTGAQLRSGIVQIPSEEESFAVMHHFVAK